MAILLAASVPACGLVKSFQRRPRVTLEGVDVVDVTFQAATLKARLAVENRIPVSIGLAKVEWAVAIEDRSLGQGEITSPVQVPANGSTPVEVPFTVAFADLYRILEAYRDRDEAPYRLDGKLAVDTPLGPLSLPFRHHGTLPVLKVPAVDLVSVKASRVNFAGAELELGFKVKNPNTVALAVETLDYDVRLAGLRLADGRLRKGFDLPAKGHGAFSAEVRLSFAQVTTAVQQVLGRSSADYSVGGNFSARTPWGSVTTPYSKSGTVRIQN